MPRFVILAHDHPFAHWDLMLEDGEFLRTWRLMEMLQIGANVEAEELGPHRIAYLDYEGPVSGGRGFVRRVDAGFFEWREQSKQQVVLDLTGHLLCGRLTMIQLDDRWSARLATIADSWTTSP